MSDMLMTASEYQTATLDQWEDAFWALYGHWDKDLPLYDMILQIVADSTRLAEAIRKDRFDEALPLIPHIFSWLCNLATTVRLNDKYGDISSGKRLADLIWEKYPRVCPLCTQERCICPALHPDNWSRDERQRHNRERAVVVMNAQREYSRPVSLDEWIAMFDEIYGPVNAHRTSAEKLFHFFEEVGEVEVELRKADRMLRKRIPRGREAEYRTVHWEPEMADVFSWLTAIYHHICGRLRLASHFLRAYNEQIGTAQEHLGELTIPSFSEWVWTEFTRRGDGRAIVCPSCGDAHCSCGQPLERR